ncbi:LEAF RUST 10 DISEASE-RESISTANCE LOCUS RECEPTOR-LIKE PROTEIN KINASE-like 2.2 [Thalictrum thalictroides]|uniref:LEAF RUST 10 DISEASE-RESISTANCE LOCUS RECEPTOR-LIKE PROTEIN KINASE-like 2.2 n=1 Tax=Thalictrum thalictroides TaxID=46969 RepID=A0A7J6WM26_THATH|nr:LEAF RUST 10 DISEASE-RESISTANCE LOCUS RECEPTOR-LIKE PROTEIN KINASE-like 2.2 [Thalictrum thalictroides]
MWWMKCGPVTEKSDVYSFGMVVLEMAGMRKNFEADASKSSEMYFPGWVFNHRVMNAISGEDSGDTDNGRVVDSKWHTCEGKEEKDMAMRMELVGLWCIQFEPSKRPSMRKVVDMLEGNVVIEIPSAPFDGRFPGSVWRNNVPIVQQLETTSSIEITQSSEYLHGR